MTFSIHAEHLPPINLVVSTRLAIYNSKSSKPNGSASLFRKKLNYVPKLLIKSPIQPTWWFNPLFVVVFAKILFLTAKTSLLAEPPLRVLTIAPLLPPQHVLLLPLLHLSSLRLLFLAPPTLPWLGTWRMTSSGLSEPSLRPDLFFLRLLQLFRLPLLPPLRIMKAYVSGLWKLGFQTFIRVKLTWSITISSSSAKITLPPPVPRVQIEFRLRPSSWRILPCSPDSNASIR